MSAFHWPREHLWFFEQRRKRVYRRVPRLVLEVEALESRSLPSLVTLAAFNKTDGASPLGNLIEDSNGNFFGTTSLGGTYNDGTIFEIASGSGTITTLASFNGTDGFLPSGDLAFDSIGNLFGTTQFGGMDFNGGTNTGDGTVFELVRGSATITTVCTFNGSNGKGPVGGLLYLGGADFIGTTSGGGVYGFGTVFDVDAGTVFTDVSFDGTHGRYPAGGLAQIQGGVFIGTCSAGGPQDNGSIFEFQRGVGSTTLHLFSLAEGSSPQGDLVEDSSGDLIGTTQSGGLYNLGTIFELPVAVFAIQQPSVSINTLASFSGTGSRQPYGSLILDSAGNLFGTASGGSAALFGSVFELKAHQSSVTTLVSFNGTNGVSPIGSLIEDSNGDLFGTAEAGGPAWNPTTRQGGFGTVFELNAPPNVSLSSPGNATVGYPYAATISASGDTGPFTFTATGTLPPGLTLSKAGVLSGTPKTVGRYVFAVTATNSQGNSGTAIYPLIVNPSITITPFTTLAAFDPAVGISPESSVVEDGSGNLFTVAGGGPSGAAGTLVELANGATSLTVAAEFGKSAGLPVAAPVFDSAGNLYGTAVGDGFSSSANGLGTVYEVQQGSGTVTTLASFDGKDGNFPSNSVILDSNGNLFGTAWQGGALWNPLQSLFGDGTVFEVKQGSGTIDDLYDFNGTDGSSPNGGLVEDSNGDLFGTTTNGGIGSTGPNTGNPTGFGTVFELPYDATTQSYGRYSVLAYFNELDGAFPVGNLLLDTSGNLFGTTSEGGPLGSGTVFELPYNASTQKYGSITTLAGFPNGTLGGDTSLAGLVEDSSGNLFGTTVSGGPDENSNPASLNAGNGIVFEVPKGSGIAITVYPFRDKADEGHPWDALQEDASGDLFGTTKGEWNTGGTGYGTIFEVTSPQTNTLPTATARAAFLQTLIAYGGTGTCTFTAAPADLPPGLMLSSAGVLSGVPTMAGTYTFTVTATDSVGASASHTYSMTVNPAVPPFFSQYLLTPVGSSSVQAGSGVLIALQAADQYGDPITNYSGPATVTAAVSPTATGSSFPTSVAINASGFGYFLAEEQQAGTCTISVMDSTGTLTGSTTITVVAGPAAKLAFVTQPLSIPTGVAQPKPVLVQVEDLYGNLIASDNSDIVTVGVGTGPGPFLASSTLTAAVHNGVATFNNLALVVPGTYQLSASVAGLYTGPYSASFQILPLQVSRTNFFLSWTGFALWFNTYFATDSTTALYGQGSGASAPVPAATLTRIADGAGNPVDNPIAGSLLISPVSYHWPPYTLVFVATDTTLEADYGTPILPAGTYRVVLHSDSFQANNSGGGSLDGLGTGVAGSGDFTKTFTISQAQASEDAVWAPATADGPGQALSAPGKNQADGGYPIYLDDSSGTVTSVQVGISYDPKLLHITGVAGSNFSVLYTEPGSIIVAYNGPPLPAGSHTPIGYLIATVPAGTASDPTPYRAKDLLHLGGVVINGYITQVTTGDGLHLVAYAGDANGDGAYTSADAKEITRVVLQTDTGFTAYPLVDPVIVADTDGSGFIPADAALQANEAGVGVPTANLPVPPLPPGVHFLARTESAHPSARIITEVFSKQVQTTKETKQPPADLRPLLDAALSPPWLDDDTGFFLHSSRMGWRVSRTATSQQYNVNT
jgi:uncharacterized repeat protein (TIGR03803 family)